MNLLIQPETFHCRRESFGMEYLSFSVRRMARGESFTESLGKRELAIVMLAGKCAVTSTHGSWHGIGERKNVFDGMPWTLYLPIDTQYTVTAETDCEVAFCYSDAEESHPAQLIRPADVASEIRGGGNATRQINAMLPPSFPAHRLLVVEVYTPAGNWSSFPPHKHDIHNPPEEVDLDEIYYYKMDRPEGFAIQRVYTADRRLDETITVRDGQLVMVPEGYHPVVAAHGYNVYYLNVLAGSARSMAATDDPEFAWTRQSWKERDPRVPVVKGGHVWMS